MGNLPKGADPMTAQLTAWSFLIKDEEMVPRMKGVLTKVIFETNMKEDIERATDRDDESWLECQVVGDCEENIDMEGVEKIDEYEF